MSKYIVIKNELERDFSNSTLVLFVRLFSGRYSEIEKDKLPTALEMSNTVFLKSWRELVESGYIVESEKGFTVTDEPSTDPVTVSVGLFESDNPLLKWLNKECPRVQKMKQPITEKQAKELLRTFSTDSEKKILSESFQAMENCAPLHQKYVSAKTTVVNWTKLRLEKQPPNSPTTPNKKYVPTA